jgi:flagellar biosynthesis/type III secretory pathway protein FliH
MVSAGFHRPSSRPPGVLFAEDFDTPVLATLSAGPATARNERRDEPRIVPPEPPPDIEAIRRVAYQQGHAEGHAAAKAEMDSAAAASAEATRRLLARVAGSLADASQASARVSEEAAEAVARLLLGTLAAMMPALCARHGAAEVASVARCILPSLVHAPEIVIRVGPRAVAALQSEFARLDPELGERIVLTPCDGVAEGDVRILWQDGSASRDSARLWQTVAEALAPLGLLDTSAPCAATQ